MDRIRVGHQVAVIAACAIEKPKQVNLSHNLTWGGFESSIDKDDLQMSLRFSISFFDTG